MTQDGATTADEDADNILEEQEALGNFVAANFPDEDTAFAQAEQSVFNDARIVQLARNGEIDRILLDEAPRDLKITKVADLDSGETELFTGGSEVVSVSEGRAYVTNGAQDRIDVFNTATGEKTLEIDLTGITGYNGVQSVAAKGGIVAAAISVTPEAENGVVALFDTSGMLQGTITVGNLPDSVIFSPDGTKIIVANEGEPLDDSDPLGSVSIIDVSGGAAAATVVTLDFSAFDGQEDALRAAGVQIEPGNSASADLEPEYATVTPDGKTAWVSLQEANAYAIIDLETATVTDIRSFGTSDRSLPGFEIDASNSDNAINLQNYDNLFGLRQPDAITSIEIGGETYILTANEGDARDATEARVADLTLDADAFPDAEILQLDENLGRLNVRSDIGDTDGDGDFDVLYHYGSRSFTIYDLAGNLVFDSGSTFSQLVAEIRPDLFNTSDNTSADGRSDDKGVEPEAIAAGRVGDKTYAFIGLERDNGIMVFDISDPTAPTFEQYIDSAQNGNISPETIAFVPAEDSPTGNAQIAVAYEGDGATVVYDLTENFEVLEVSAGAETVTGTAAKDIISGTASEFSGDTIQGLELLDAFLFEGTDVQDVVIDMLNGTADLGGSSFSFLTTNLVGAEALAVSAASGANTSVRFVEDDQELNEAQTVDAEDINGIIAQDFLSGTGRSNIDITLSTKTGADFDNILGVYEIDAQGRISDVQIGFASTQSGTGTFTIANDDISEGTELGFFLIQDGANLLGDVASDSFEFVNSVTGSAGSVNDAGNIQLRRNGDDVDVTVFHSTNPLLNPDMAVHVLSGAVDSNTLQLGFEDLIDGDDDFQDVVVTVMHDYF